MLVRSDQLAVSSFLLPKLTDSFSPSVVQNVDKRGPAQSQRQGSDTGGNVCSAHWINDSRVSGTALLSLTSDTVQASPNHRTLSKVTRLDKIYFSGSAPLLVLLQRLSLVVWSSMHQRPLPNSVRTLPTASTSLRPTLKTTALHDLNGNTGVSVS